MSRTISQRSTRTKPVWKTEDSRFLLRSSTRVSRSNICSKLQHQHRFKKQSSSSKLIFPLSDGTSWSGKHFESSSVTQSTASRSSPNPSNWLTFDRLSRLALLEPPSKACHEGRVTIVMKSESYKRVMIDPAYSMKLMCAQYYKSLHALKDRSGKEQRCLHCVLSQHLRSLKVMEYKPVLFITSLIEIKLNQATGFEWQRHIQGTSKVPHHGKLLKFSDLRARVSESTTRENIKRSAQSAPHKAYV